MQKKLKEVMDKVTSAQIQSILPFWSSINLNEQREIINETLIKTFEGTELGEMHEVFGQCGYMVVLSGSVNIMLISMDGARQRLLKMKHGEMGIIHVPFQQYKGDFYVECLFESGTVIGKLPSKTMDRLFRQNTHMKDYYIDISNEIISKLVTLVADLSFLSLSERLVKTLQEDCQDNNSKTISTTHEELANDLGTSREVITRLLKQL